MANKILVVDDEPRILKVVEHSLRAEGFQVLKANDGDQALFLADRENPDLIVLDLMMPRMDGFEVCTVLRQKSNVPILVLSAKSAEIDKVLGFKLGIDDYLTKPFSPTELVLRVKAILRRSSQNRTETNKQISFGPLEMDATTRRVMVNGKLIELTAKEFDLLWLLASHPRQVFTRAQLLNHIWETDFIGDTNTVTVLVKRVREKIEQDPSQPALIRTVWGVGYKFDPDRTD